MIKRSRWMQAMMVGGAAMVLAACGDSATMPDLGPAYDLSSSPTGLPGEPGTFSADTDPEPGCIRYGGGTCVMAPIGVTVEPLEQPSTDPCDYDPGACGSPSGGGSPIGGNPAGPTPPPPSDCVPRDAGCDEGPIVFAGCMARNLGYSGGAALVAAGFNAYLAYDARQDAIAANGRWFLYHQKWDIPGSGWTEEHDRFLKALADEAKETELQVYAAFVGTGTNALFRVAKAAAICLPGAVVGV